MILSYTSAVKEALLLEYCVSKNSIAENILLSSQNGHRVTCLAWSRKLGTTTTATTLPPPQGGRDNMCRWGVREHVIYGGDSDVEHREGGAPEDNLELEGNLVDLAWSREREWRRSGGRRCSTTLASVPGRSDVVCFGDADGNAGVIQVSS